MAATADFDVYDGRIGGPMLTSVEGVFQDGEVKLTEPVPEGASGRVIVTFLPVTTSIDLKERGIDKEQAVDLRARLSAFA